MVENREEFQTLDYEEEDNNNLLKKSLELIFLGLMLSVLSIDISILSFVLPFFGYLCLILGLRTLRKENKSLKIAYLIVDVQLMLLFFTTILSSTIYNSYLINNVPYTFTIVILKSILVIAFLISLRIGLLDIQKKAGIDDRLKSLTYLSEWYGVLIVLGMFHAGFLLAMIMLIAYIIILVKVNKEFHALSSLHDYVCYADNKISNKIFVILTLSSFLVLIILAYTFANSYPMKWTEFNQKEDKEIASIKMELVKKGFPVEILKDISTEDIKSCEGVVDVENNEDHRHDFNEYDGIAWHYIPICVKIKTKDEGKYDYRIFNYFRWDDGMEFYGTEFIDASCVRRHTMKGDFGGRVLYDKEENSYVAPFYWVDKSTYVANSMTGRNSQVEGVMASFSFPKHAKNARGYIAYTVEEEWGQKSYIESNFSYTHQKALFQYPVITAKDYRQNKRMNMFYFSDVFVTNNIGLSFYHSVE